MDNLSVVLGWFAFLQLNLGDMDDYYRGHAARTCATHDVAFVAYLGPGKLHHLSFYMKSWEHVQRASDIMGMKKVPIDIGPTRHGTTRAETIYAWDPSGNRFETFGGSYAPYPDYETITWTHDAFGYGLDFPHGKLHESFLTIVT
ncbi:VOC family protein [Eoetvoesiella caeni]